MLQTISTKVFILSVLMYSVSCECGEYMDCDNYGVLTLENSLGIIRSEEVDSLCSVIRQLDVCLHRIASDCSDKMDWLPTLQSAKYICNNIEDYKTSTTCFYDEDVSYENEMCSDDLYTEMECRSLHRYKACVVKNVKDSTVCRPEDALIMEGLLTTNLQPHLKTYNCLVPDESTTLEMTTVNRKTTSVSKQTTVTTTQTIINPNNNNWSVAETRRNRGSNEKQYTHVFVIMSLATNLFILYFKS